MKISLFEPFLAKNAKNGPFSMSARTYSNYYRRKSRNRSRTDAGG